MSDKHQEGQNKKNRLGRGLGSLLGASLTQDNAPAAHLEKPTPQKNEKVDVAQKQQATATQPLPAVHVQQASSQVSANTQTQQPVQVTNQIPPESRIWKIAVDKLHPNEYQPRQKFIKETISELAASIKEKGILSPIVARRHLSGALEIISGERRWRAAQVAGLHEVPVIIKNVNDQDSLELAIIENVQREDLNPIDEAEAYQRLVDEFKLTQQQVAEKVGKERATVANALRLLSLPLQIREMLGQQEISTGHAKVLLSIQDPKTQTQLAKKVATEKVSVRGLEKLVQQVLKNNSLDDKEDKLDDKEKNKQRLAEAVGLELQRLIGTKVNVDYNSGKGKITLAFYSDDEFNEMTEKIKKAWQK